MNVEQKVVAQLNAALPEKKFGSTLEIDPISYRARVVITANGVKTSYGFYPHLVSANVSYVQDPPAQPEDKFVAEFVKNMLNSFNKDFNRL
jgi:hypothetical protein